MRRDREPRERITQYQDDTPVGLQPTSSTHESPHCGALHWKAEQLSNSIHRSIYFGMRSNGYKLLQPLFDSPELLKTLLTSRSQDTIVENIVYSERFLSIKDKLWTL